MTGSDRPSRSGLPNRPPEGNLAVRRSSVTAIGRRDPHMCRRQRDYRGGRPAGSCRSAARRLAEPSGDQHPLAHSAPPGRKPRHHTVALAPVVKTSPRSRPEPTPPLTASACGRDQQWPPRKVIAAHSTTSFFRRMRCPPVIGTFCQGDEVAVANPRIRHSPPDDDRAVARVRR